MDATASPRPFLVPALVLALAACSAAPADPAETEAGAGDDAALLARGEYLVRIAGCNDCHTPAYADRGGQAPRPEWLTGSPLGFRGPWGTTYAPNLRLKLAEMDERQWLAYSANLRTRPIMPDFALRQMAEEDRRALYRFVRSLGPGGAPAPAYVPPDRQPVPPYFELVLAPAAASR